MTPQLIQIKKTLLERKSWLNNLNKLNELSISNIDVFGEIDAAFTLENITKNEKDWKEFLAILNGEQITAIEVNAKPLLELNIGENGSVLGVRKFIPVDDEIPTLRTNQN